MPEAPTKQQLIDALRSNGAQAFETLRATPAAVFEKNRNILIAAVQVADEDLLSRTIRSAACITGTVADVIAAVANGHVQMHVADVGGTRRICGVTS